MKHVAECNGVQQHVVTACGLRGQNALACSQKGQAMKQVGCRAETWRMMKCDALESMLHGDIASDTPLCWPVDSVVYSSLL